MNSNVKHRNVILWILVGTIIAATFFLTDMFNLGNVETLRLLVVVFSILSGVVVVVITAASNPNRLYRKNWRTVSIHRRMIRRQLNFCAFVLCIYLSVVILAWIAVTLFDVVPWLDNLALGFGVGGFTLSFIMPWIMVRSYMDILDREAEKERKSKMSPLGVDGKMPGDSRDGLASPRDSDRPNDAVSVPH